MAALKFPFWIVTQRRGLISQPVEPEGMQGFAAAFSTAENAARYMVACGKTEWENRLVTGPATLQTLMADLRQIGMKGFCLDPGEDKCNLRLHSMKLAGRPERVPVESCPLCPALVLVTCQAARSRPSATTSNTVPGNNIQWSGGSYKTFHSS